MLQRLQTNNKEKNLFANFVRAISFLFLYVLKILVLISILNV